MKKIFLTILAITAQFAANALDYNTIKGYINDGYNWSQNNYYGTARSLGMGNAMTAVGGDLGSITLNPAGSAVASYSQLTLTPGVSIAMTGGGFEDNRSDRYSRGRFVFPNGGFTFNFDTNRPTGLKRVSVGFVANSTNIFNDGLSAYSLNNTSSYGAACAYSASGTAPGVFINYNGPSALNTAFHSGLIQPIWPGPDDKPTNYIGFEDSYDSATGSLIPGTIKQSYLNSVRGVKTDFLINLAFDISDIVYVGANLGLVSLKYGSQEDLEEVAVDPSKFHRPDSHHHFKGMNYSYQYSARGSGVYGKFGILAAPVAGLRIGAAIQTPTLVNISESWSHYTRSEYFEDDACSKTGSNYSVSENNSRIRLVSPFRFNMGLAYTFGHFAVISADYEIANFRHMRFRGTNAAGNSEANEINRQIQGAGEGECLSPQHMVRVGAEIKPTQEFIIRAGYGLTTSGKSVRAFNGQISRIGDNQQSFSFGLGYDSPGSFFCDIAAQYIKRTEKSMTLHNDYCAFKEDKYVENEPILSPVATATRGLLNIVATFGWRF